MARHMKPWEIQKKRNAKTGVRIRNSRGRKRKSRLTNRQIFLIVVLLFVFMGSGIGYVWSNFEGTQIGYDLSRLQQKEFKLRDLNQKLRLELATLKSPQNLEEATRGLGLRQPLPGQIIILP